MAPGQQGSSTGYPAPGYFFDSHLDLVLIITKALLFFIGALFVGQKLMPGVVHFVSLNKHSSVWTGFAFCLALAFAQLAVVARHVV